MFSAYGNGCINLSRNSVKPRRISNVKSFINKYNPRELNLSSKIDYCETFEKNNQTITFNFLYTKEK